MSRRTSHAPALLCAVQFPANTGFAWDLLERVYALTADALDPEGIRTFVAYPEIQAPPRTLEGSVAEPVELDACLRTRASLDATRAFVRDHDVRAMLLIDQASFNHRYAGVRRAGVERIVVYDHVSGARLAPRGLRRLLKRASRSIGSFLADEVLAVSEYNARRQVEVGLVPPERVHTVHSGLDVVPENPGARERLRSLLGVEPDRIVIGCAARAAPEKGIEYLLEAFDLACARWEPPYPALVFFGDGPDLERLRGIAASLRFREHVSLPGYLDGAADLLEGADVCVVPSVWQDALPLAVLGAMARGRPVLGTRVGGVPEMIEDGTSGLLAPPRDPRALANGLEHLVANEELRRSLGRQARRRVARHFRLEDQIARVCDSVRPAFHASRGSMA